ncbi:hypothetical protein EBB07_23800 [Paenibacillaceae bacterium]|nr:hypothetical protein EBB07_23800 [Paenibacillaceae bacterium]
MGNNAERMISIFDDATPEQLQKESLHDLVKLAGVMTELKDYFGEPLKILECLKVFNLLQREALGLDEPLEDGKALHDRFLLQYGDEPAVPLERMLNVLQKHGWVMRTKRKLLMMDVGKRSLDMLIRLANESLAYYMQDEVARLLFQANRDIDLLEMYDDKGISGGNRLASMISHVEDAVDKLQERQLELLADRYALPQIQLIVKLMKELSWRMDARIRQYAVSVSNTSNVPKVSNTPNVPDVPKASNTPKASDAPSAPKASNELNAPSASDARGSRNAPSAPDASLSALLSKGAAVMAAGLQAALGTLNKYMKFAELQQGEVGQAISLQAIRQYIVHSYHKQPGSELPDGHEILSFMEQNREEGERLDGMWVPVQFAAPVSNQQIARVVSDLDSYIPSTARIAKRPEPVYVKPEEWSEEEARAFEGQRQWQLTRSLIRTDAVEEVLENKRELELEELVMEAGSEQWADALNTLISVSALVSGQHASMEPTDEEQPPNQTDRNPEDNKREWNLMNGEATGYVVRRTGTGEREQPAAWGAGAAYSGTESG